MAKRKHYQLTKEGLENLKKELKERTDVIRKNLQDQLDADMQEGDISENTSYYRVQEEIASNERRIGELQTIIANAVTVNGDPGDTDTVDIGNSVTIKVRDREITYHIVGSTEADPAQNKVSVDSPLGRALIGKKIGENAVVKTPLGSQSYDIIRIG